MRKIIYMVLLASSFIACKDKPTVAVYEGKDISGEFSFEREKMTKTAMFQIKTPGKWELFVGQSVEGIDFSNPFLEGEGEGVYMLNLPDTVRSYFQLKTPGGKAIFAESHLPMTGGYNFRDLGGYRTQEGRYIKWGKLIRSDELHHLTKKDLKYLSGVPIQTIVDFRSESERNTDPDKRPSSVGQVYELSIMPGNVRNIDLDHISFEYVAGIMKEMNVMFVTDPDCVEQYRKFFNILQQGSNTGILFHCAAGKDRTGLAAALVLYALGVDEKTIMSDYLASNSYLAGKYEEWIAKNPVYKDLFSVKEEFLNSALDEIKKTYGSIENFLTKELQVDIERFKELYVY